MNPLDELTTALRALPGVGLRSAQRMAWHLLQHNRPGAARLALALTGALDKLRHCQHCNSFSQTDTCPRCAHPDRDPRQLCIVERPSDLEAIEQGHSYKGHYYVLMGHLSPLDGIGPRELALDKLIARATNGSVEEIILATNFTNEGEATAHWICQRLQTHPLRITRLARGVPVGGELEYTDAGTIAQALIERRTLHQHKP